MHPSSERLLGKTKWGEKATKECQNFMIQHVGSELLKMLQAVIPDGSIISRNNLDIPDGLFGFSLKKFNERIKMDTIYLYRMQILRKEVLEEVKDYIVLTDLHALTRELFTAFAKNRRRGALKEIRDASKLLTKHEAMEAERTSLLNRLREAEETETRRNSEAEKKFRKIDLRVMEKINSIKERRNILSPLEFRYEMNFAWSFADCRLFHQLKEEECRKEINHENYLRDQEYMCSSSIFMKLKADIKDYKRRIVLMERKYYKDMDEMTSKYDYLKNSALVLESIMNDYKAKLEFFQTDTPRLIEWYEMREQEKREKERAEAINLILMVEAGMKEKRGQKNKSARQTGRRAK